MRAFKGERRSSLKPRPKSDWQASNRLNLLPAIFYVAPFVSLRRERFMFLKQPDDTWIYFPWYMIISHFHHNGKILPQVLQDAPAFTEAE